MAKILIIDKDDQSVPVIKELLKDHEVTHTPSMVEGLEHLNKNMVECLIVDTTALDKDFRTWRDNFKQKCLLTANHEVKMVVLSHKEDMKQAMKITQAGALDYIIKPIDRPLFLQKIGLVLTGQVEKQVYTYATETPINMAFEGIVEEISEFGATLKFAREVKVGDIVTLFSDIFKVDGHSEVLARCYKCGPHPKERSAFQLQCMFVGVNQAVLKQIRSWLRQEYVRKKQKAA